MPKKKTNETQKGKKKPNNKKIEKNESDKSPPEKKKKKTKKKAKKTDMKPLTLSRIVLRAYVISLSAIKTLNDSFKNGTFLMKLSPTSVFMKYKGGEKTIRADTYQVKGLKGMIRHLLMELLDFLGISVCHTTARTTYGKDNQPAIPEDSFVHPLGECLDNGKDEDGKSKKSKTRSEGCLIYQIFGAMLEESIIKIDPVLIAQTNGQGKVFPTTAKDFDPTREVYYAHVATEARNVMTIDQKPIQDFREGYFDGNFVINIDVTKCTPTQIGALSEALFNAKELGAGKTNGYGRIEINRLELCQIEESRQIVLTENGLEKLLVENEINLNPKLQEACTAWEAYKTANRSLDRDVIPAELAAFS